MGQSYIIPDGGSSGIRASMTALGAWSGSSWSVPKISFYAVDNTSFEANEENNGITCKSSGIYTLSYDVLTDFSSITVKRNDEIILSTPNNTTGIVNKGSLSFNLNIGDLITITVVPINFTSYRYGYGTVTIKRGNL